MPREQPAATASELPKELRILAPTSLVTLVDTIVDRYPGRWPTRSDYIRHAMFAVARAILAAEQSSKEEDGAEGAEDFPSFE